MKGVVKYRIFCITENKFVYKIFEEDHQVDLVCFDDPNHEINEDSLLAVDKIDNNELFIVEERIKTQGNLRCQGYIMNIPQNSTGEYDVMFKRDVNLTCVMLDCKEENIGHSVSACTVPFLDGMLTQNCSGGTDIIYVDPVSFMIANLGYNVILHRVLDGFEQDLGEIMEINIVNGYLKIENLLTNDFVTGDVLKFKVYGIKDMFLSLKGRYSLGENKIGSSFVDKRNVTKLIYKNTSEYPVSFTFTIEYLY